MPDQKNLCTVQNCVRVNEEQWRKDINVQFSLHKEKEKSEEKGRKIDSTHESSQMRTQLCLFTEFKVALIQSILGVLATETPVLRETADVSAGSQRRLMFHQLWKAVLDSRHSANAVFTQFLFFNLFRWRILKYCHNIQVINGEKWRLNFKATDTLLCHPDLL